MKKNEPSEKTVLKERYISIKQIKLFIILITKLYYYYYFFTLLCHYTETL